MTATHFGKATVALADKPGLVQDLFSSVADSYDLMNDVLSFGVHRLWKDALVDWVKPRPGQDFLDLAGGTGDLAFRLAHRVKGQQASLTVCDFTLAMVQKGEKRAEQKTGLGPISWVTGDALTLPFADRSFDVTTLAFGLRNMAIPQAALSEIRRILRPGGYLFCLEFSKVVLPILDRAYQVFSLQLIPRLGQLVAGQRDAYQYLIDSIEKFPDQENLATLFLEAGFDQVRYRNLSGGIAAIHQGLRL